VLLIVGALAALSSPAIAAPALPAPRVIVGVTCRTTTLCVAVGANTNRQPYIQRFNGQLWTRDATPAVANGELDAVACGSGKSCVAVGHRGNATSMKPLAERWNGSDWKVASLPSVAGSSKLSGVSCVTAHFCVAVGYFTAGSTLHTLVYQWSGTAWKRVGSPSPTTGGVGSWLTSISCTGVRNCFAVGSTYDGRTDDPFVIRWSGSAWAVSVRQHPNGDLNWLQGVSCAPQTKAMCMAVGVDNTAEPMASFKDRWNGKTWRITVGLPDRTDVVLESVSCGSATNCVAVGTRNLDTPYAERWNGTSWARIASPTGALDLTSVVCIRPASCYAVGGTVVRYWNGTKWTNIPDAI
jgi:hypothetical protein